VVKLLLKQEASIDWTTDMRRTPLCIAVKAGAEDLCKVLLINGVDPNSCDVFSMDFPDPRTGGYTGTWSLL
jgi:ankyrin repeat protein